jgi:hypothetical protein
VIPTDEVRHAERRARPGRIHHPAAAGLVEIEGAPAIAARQLVVLSGPDEGVIAWVEWKENPNPSLLIGLKNEGVAVGGSPKRDLSVLAAVVLPAVVQGDRDRGWRAASQHRGSGDRSK